MTNTNTTKTETLPHMLSSEMASIARASKAPKPTIDTLVNEAKDAIDRAQTLIIDHPQDPNAAMLELNLAFGLLETLDQNAPMIALEMEIL